MNFSFAPHIKFSFDSEPKGVTRPLFKQVHGTEIIEIGSPSHWETLLRTSPPADGAYTFERRVPVYAFSADCLPLLFFSTKINGPVAAVHSGWRGARSGIAGELLSRLASWKDSLHVILGPCIMKCCFEVKEDFIDDFSAHGADARSAIEERNGNLYFDLPQFVRRTSLATLPEDHIHDATLTCTVCSRPEWPSFRRNRGTDPHICARIVNLG